MPWLASPSRETGGHDSTWRQPRSVGPSLLQRECRGGGPSGSRTALNRKIVLFRLYCSVFKLVIGELSCPIGIVLMGTGRRRLRLWGSPPRCTRDKRHRGDPPSPRKSTSSVLSTVWPGGSRHHRMDPHKPAPRAPQKAGGVAGNKRERSIATTTTSSSAARTPGASPPGPPSARARAPTSLRRGTRASALASSIAASAALSMHMVEPDPSVLRPAPLVLRLESTTGACSPASGGGQLLVRPRLLRHCRLGRSRGRQPFY